MVATNGLLAMIIAAAMGVTGAMGDIGSGELGLIGLKEYEMHGAFRAEMDLNAITGRSEDTAKHTISSTYGARVNVTDKTNPKLEASITTNILSDARGSYKLLVADGNAYTDKQTVMSVAREFVNYAEMQGYAEKDATAKFNTVIEELGENMLADVELIQMTDSVEIAEYESEFNEEDVKKLVERFEAVMSKALAGYESGLVEKTDTGFTLSFTMDGLVAEAKKVVSAYESNRSDDIDKEMYGLYKDVVSMQEGSQLIAMEEFKAGIDKTLADAKDFFKAAEINGEAEKEQYTILRDLSDFKGSNSVIKVGKVENRFNFESVGSIIYQGKDSLKWDMRYTIQPGAQEIAVGEQKVIQLEDVMNEVMAKTEEMLE